MNARCKFDSLKGEHKRWVLFNDLGTWKLDTLHIVTGRSTDDKIFVEICGREIEITRKNIDSYMRSVSNATVFLSNAERRLVMRSSDAPPWRSEYLQRPRESSLRAERASLRPAMT